MYKALVAGFSLALMPSGFARSLERKQSSPTAVFGFDSIEATAELDWKPCFDEFTCTKIRVPLDYENEAAGTTHIAFIKWSSNSTTANSTQDILLNPGGPGVPGVEFLLSALPLLQGILGTDHNLISFDPRGVNNSGPNLSCFQGRLRGTTRFYREFVVPMEANNTRSYSEVYQRAAAFGDFCTAAHNGTNDTAKYVNTVATATDMLHYTELLAKSKGQDPQNSQLWYYGGSYGTILGTTFATLFPERVGRVIVDGVADGEDYFQGKWLANLPDADAAIRYFFQTCFDAGRNGTCKFWAESPSAIEVRFQALVKELTFNPIPVSTSGVPLLVGVDELKQVVLTAATSPVETFPAFDDILTQLEARIGDAITAFSEFSPRLDSCSPEAAQLGDFEPRQFIACTDANGRYNLSTLDAWKDHADTLINQSQYYGEVWASNTAVNCHKLKIKAPASQVLEGFPGANKTSNPLLFLSTKIDPVTPLRAAEKMVARFGGARLLIQDSVGHTTTSSFSRCTARYIQEYYKSGSLPDVGAQCQPDMIPFQDNISDAASARMLMKRRLFGF